MPALPEVEAGAQCVQLTELRVPMPLELRERPALRKSP